MPMASLSRWTISYFAAALAFLLAAASWFLVERPALHLKKRFVARAPEASPVAAQAN